MIINLPIKGIQVICHAADIFWLIFVHFVVFVLQKLIITNKIYKLFFIDNNQNQLNIYRRHCFIET